MERTEFWLKRGKMAVTRVNECIVDHELLLHLVASKEAVFILKGSISLTGCVQRNSFS